MAQEATQHAKGQTLFTLDQALSDFESLFDPESGFTEEDLKAGVDAFLASVGEGIELVNKIDKYAGLIRKLEGLADSRTEYAKSVAQSAKSMLNSTSAMKEALKAFFEAHPAIGNKLVCPVHTVSHVSNGGVKPLLGLGDVDPEKLPEQYVETVKKPLADVIRKALDQETPDEKLTALGITLGQRGTRIAIK